ncbi:MAG: DUF2480 family protein [Spirosomataceae bacterium]
MSEEIINKVALSGLITLDLAEFYTPGERMTYDLADHLYMGLILREKDLREALKSQDTSVFQGKFISIHCSADAIIPQWAYMLLVLQMAPHASYVHVGSPDELEFALFQQAFDRHDFSPYEGQRVVVKGCGDIAIPSSVYGEITRRLQPLVKSLMFGEPCSTVPLFKKK